MNEPVYLLTDQHGRKGQGSLKHVTFMTFFSYFQHKSKNTSTPLTQPLNIKKKKRLYEKMA